VISFFLAQIQPVEPTVVNQLGQEFVIDAGVLSENGRNIFHTFEQFGLTQEQMANFLANPETENIFNRVNGNDSSFIDGFIKVTGGNPDFYFLNPNGIIFGQHAQINVPAAFYASTATSLQFGND
jgi:filamentous hemagglutinin family protein